MEASLFSCILLPHKPRRLQGGAWPPKGLTKMKIWPNLQYFALFKKQFPRGHTHRPPNLLICSIFLALADAWPPPMRTSGAACVATKEKGAPNQNVPRGPKGVNPPLLSLRIHRLNFLHTIWYVGQGQTERGTERETESQGNCPPLTPSWQ